MPEDTPEQVPAQPQNSGQKPQTNEQTNSKWYKLLGERSVLIIAAILLVFLALVLQIHHLQRYPDDLCIVCGLLLVVSPLLLVGSVFVRSRRRLLIVIGVPIIVIILATIGGLFYFTQIYDHRISLEGDVLTPQNPLQQGEKERVDITIYLKDSASDSQIDSLTKEIESVDGVKEVLFYTKEEVYQLYIEINKDNPYILESVNPDILPAQIEVKLSDASADTMVKEIVNNKEFTETLVLY